MVVASDSISAPDISLASPSVAINSLWRVLEDPRGSDHYPIFISLGGLPLYKCSTRPKIRVNKVKWSVFSTELDQRCLNIEVNRDNFLQMYDNMIDIIKDSLRVSGARVPNGDGSDDVSRDPPPAIWWTPECSEKIEERRNAARAYRNEISNRSYENYLTVCKTVKKFVDKAKTKSSRSFCESLGPNTPINLIWRPIKAFRRRFDSPDSVSSTSPEDPEVQKAFLKIAPPFVSEEENFVDNLAVESLFEAPISLKELENSIAKARNRAAPGLDLITNVMLKNTTLAFRNIVCRIFNFIMELCRIPEEWIRYLVCLIPKPGGKGVRPIAISSSILKVLERIVNSRLQWWCENNFVIPPNFFGFRPGRSCLDNVAVLVTDINLTYVKKEFLVAAFIDIEGA